MSGRKPSAAPVVDPLDDFPWLDFGHAVVNFETGQIVNMRDEGADGADDRTSGTPAADNGRETSGEG